VLVGDFFIRDKLYARFVEARLPDGRRVPFCGELYGSESEDVGADFLPGSQPGAPRVGALQKVRAMYVDH
jgi:hypothetical protein